MDGSWLNLAESELAVLSGQCLEGWRHVEVTERRTAIDYARILKDLSDVHFARAEKIVLVQDNLNSMGSLQLLLCRLPGGRLLIQPASTSFGPSGIRKILA